MLSLTIPRYDATNDLHREIARAAEHAVQAAADVKLKEGTHFVRTRKLIREALKEDGLLLRIDELVATLLGDYQQ